MEPENKPDSNAQPTTPPPAAPSADPTPPVEAPVTPVEPTPMPTSDPSMQAPLNPAPATVGTGKKSSAMVWLLIILVLAIAGFLAYWFLLR